MKAIEAKRLSIVVKFKTNIYLIISSDNKYIILGNWYNGYDDRIDIIDFKTGKLLYRLKPIYSFDRKTGELLQNHIYFYHSVITDDGENIIFFIKDDCYPDDYNIAIWNFKTDSLSNIIRSDTIFNFAIDKKDRFIVTDDGKILDFQTGELLQTLQGRGCDDFERIAIDNEDKIVVGGSDVGDVEIWDIKTGKLLRTLKGHLSAIIGVAISNDGETIVSGS